RVRSRARNPEPAPGGGRAAAGAASRDRAADRGAAGGAAAPRFRRSRPHSQRSGRARRAPRRRRRWDTMETQMTTNAPAIRTPLPGPRPKAIIDRDRAVVSPSYTRGYPLVIERGYGAMVEDVDGNVFLDCAAGIAVNSTGHSHPDVVAAINAQAQKFLHMSG